MSEHEQLPERLLAVAIRQTPETRDLPLPAYQTGDAAGMDLYAAVDEPVTLAPGERAAIPTGVHVGIPRGWEGQVRGRSGLAFKHGIGLANGVGTIDADYTGMVQVLLINLGREPFTISRGLRIAQLVVAPVARVVWEPVESLEETARGAGGFGHTGMRSDTAATPANSG